MADPLLEERSREIEVIMKESAIRNRSAPQVELLLHAYMVLGGMMTIGAIGYFGFSLLKIDLTLEQRMSVMTAGAGVLVAAMSWLLLLNRRKLEALRAETLRVAERDYDLVREWAKFEAAGRRVLQEKGVEFNSRSPRSILSALERCAVIPSELAREISMALDVRNKVVHDVDPVPPIMVQAAGRILADSNKKLNSVLQPSSETQGYGATGSSVILSATGTQKFYGGGEAIPADSPAAETSRKGTRKINLDDE
ncbi:hypothetical protein [Novosphingobium sp. SG720]|uniref:hypothetical protein n=1 Tax=Novosphingobium sp. SG720 TaxID=2586998 RepID=UPI001447A154|nr:hypothetical protein [Novosphingobium sp. SG720]NKJ40836.1 hypothetical protein [Novosphingobium sp. SG720]